jgi:hypothetical protein
MRVEIARICETFTMQRPSAAALQFVVRASRPRGGSFNGQQFMAIGIATAASLAVGRGKIINEIICSSALLWHGHDLEHLEPANRPSSAAVIARFSDSQALGAS